MPRETKFRIWDTTNHCFVYSDEKEGNCFLIKLNGEVTDGNGRHYDETYPIQQFAGIKDNVGADIYEGDIVKVYDSRNLFQIKFGKVTRSVEAHTRKENYLLELNTFFFESLENKLPFFSIINNERGEHDLKGTRIVGNIFENPELLK